MSTTLMFKLKLSQIAGRLDPQANQPLIRDYLIKINKGTHPPIALKNLVKINKRIVDAIPEGLRYVGLENINGTDGSLIEINEKLQINSGSIFEPGDILFPKLRPNLNKTHLAKEKGVCSTEFHVFTPSSVAGEYLLAYLRSDIIVGLLTRLVTGNTLPRLQTDEVLNLSVVTPPASEQEKIIHMMRDAYTQKQALETQAQSLLESVDAVLYQHLGVPTPAPQTDGLNDRIFKVRLSETSDRLDAPANWKQFAVRSIRFASEPLRDLALINPKTDFSDIDPDDLISFVPMDSVDELWGHISTQESRPYDESQGYTEFQEGDVLWAKITPCMQNGKSAIAQGLLRQRGFGSTEFHVFRVDSSRLDARYLLALLRLKYLREFAVMFFGGSAGHQRVDARFFEKLTIPLPPLTVQKEIALEIETMKVKAKEFQQQAQGILEKAKQEVEAMILGDIR